MLGLGQAVSFEGQAAMQLEALAGADDAPPYPFAVEPGEGPFVMRFTPAVRAIAEETAAGRDAGRIAARFHGTLVAALVAAARLARERRGLARAALGGGCFQNARLLEGLRQGLADAGFEVLLPATVPPNDGGLSLGQTVAAAAAEASSPCA